VAGAGRLRRRVMPISWMRSADVYLGTGFAAFDGKEIIGRIYRIRSGTQEGRQSNESRFATSLPFQRLIDPLP
jgi:hypothetical protein